MIKKKSLIIVLVIFMAFMATVLLFSGPIRAGDIEPPGAPDSTMHTLNEIYNEVRAIRYPAPVEKTGQTTSYADYDDGYYQKGVAWPAQRFTDNSDGTVTDNLTGLIWLKNANCYGLLNWIIALSVCDTLADGICSLTDSSSVGDWRLPNRKELQSLIDFGNYDPALPSGHPFTGVQNQYYWSSTTCADSTSSAWVVHLGDTEVSNPPKIVTSYVWPVRGGQ
jgi:hypothetical protein